MNHRPPTWYWRIWWFIAYTFGLYRLNWWWKRQHWWCTPVYHENAIGERVATCKHCGDEL